jgi:superfamily II DNA/RNA helicase
MFIQYCYYFVFVDTIVEAKNGTGKTLSFVIPTLVRLKVDQSNLQTIVLAPTREIAVQIQQCFKKVGQYLPGKY